MSKNSGRLSVTAKAMQVPSNQDESALQTDVRPPKTAPGEMMRFMERDSATRRENKRLTELVEQLRAELHRCNFQNMRANLTATPDTIERYRNMAADCLRDALQPEISLGGRANAAFDSCYMHCRIVMSGDDVNVEHPAEQVLEHAALRLGWKLEDVQPAMRHLEHWYATEPEFQGAEYEALVLLARRLEAATLPRG